MQFNEKLDRAKVLLINAVSDPEWADYNIATAVALIYEAAVDDATTRVLEIIVRQKQHELNFRRSYDDRTSN